MYTSEESAAVSMPVQPSAPSLVRFGVLKLDLSELKLCKQGRAIKLQDQPFQVSRLLVLRRGELITPEEVQKTLWPVDTLVEFDQGFERAGASGRPRCLSFPSLACSPSVISRSDFAPPSWQNSIAMNCPQLLNPRACRSALCFCNALSNRSRGINCRT